MKYINHIELDNMTTLYRAQLINSLSGFKSANLIGTINGESTYNLAIFSSVFHLGASPALVGFITRPNSVVRHTVENILKTKQFTINQVNDNFWQAAHQTSARYDTGVCEFKQTGLTPLIIDGVDAPFVKESRLKYALKSLNTVSISGLDSYHTSRRLSRISYAKPDSSPFNLSLDGEQPD
jgi:flavin reductase (DIM6/NTAB) family NADH-FMN oxidoreductase RutF